jgi:hypothetical protein
LADTSHAVPRSRSRKWDTSLPDNRQDQLTFSRKRRHFTRQKTGDYSRQKHKKQATFPAKKLISSDFACEVTTFSLQKDAADL